MDTHELIAAFVDGERVDAAALKAALAEAAGRDYLVDLVALREIVSDQASAVPINARPGGVVHTRQSAGMWPRRFVAAALILAGAGGYFAGHISTVSDTRQATLVAPQPPPPTRIIRLEPGVSWQEREGGH